MKRISVVVTAVPFVVFGAVLASCASPSPPSPEVVIPTAPAAPLSATQPHFGTVETQSNAPPPISGGTLSIAPDGTTAVAADPDRDRVYVVDLPARAVRHAVQLPSGSEPGRVALDDRGRAWIALRRAGSVAVVDLASGEMTTRAVCVAPRGIAFDPFDSVMRVACANGDLVTLPLDDGDVKHLAIDGELRDVVVLAKNILRVTTFRGAQVLAVDANGARNTVNMMVPESFLAWRAALVQTDAASPRSVAVIAQEATPAPIPAGPGAYYSGGVTTTGPTCTGTGLVSTRLSVAGRPSALIQGAVLPVDVASNGSEYAVVAAGNAFIPGAPQIFVILDESLRTNRGECIAPFTSPVDGQAVAAAYDGQKQLVVQTREPAALVMFSVDRRPWKTITLADDSRRDTGHMIFHANSGANIACATCHAEGADDGRAWNFVQHGARRTPALLGTVQNTAPYHWEGDMPDLRALVDHIFTERMSGPHIDDEQLVALNHWLGALPERPARAVAEGAAFEQGKQIFGNRCESCHSGQRYTSNRNEDVGTGGRFQVPSLVGVGWRAPFLHTGCARTLRDRFDPACGGAAHSSEGLSSAEIDSVVAFLETL